MTLSQLTRIPRFASLPQIMRIINHLTGCTYDEIRMPRKQHVERITAMYVAVVVYRHRHAAVGRWLGCSDSLVHHHVRRVDAAIKTGRVRLGTADMQRVKFLIQRIVALAAEHTWRVP